jgi:hypothetical protein
MPRVLSIFWLASAVAFALMFLIAWLWARAGVVRVGWDPLGDPLFGDLLENIPSFRLVHTEAFWGSPLAPTVAYPPFGAVLLGLFYATGAPSAVYVAIALLFLSLAAWCMRQALLRYGLAPWPATLFPVTIAAVSFPIEGLLQRGNIELCLWIFAAAGTWMFLRGHPNAAAILWALAAAVKLYPILFFVLLFPRRQYRAALLGAVSFAALSVASMAWLGPSLSTAWAGSLHSVFGYQGKRAGEWNLHELAENHSFFTWVKTVAVVAGHSAAALTLPYYLCGGLIFALLFFGRVARMPVANQLLAVSAFMVLLPPISYFYTLVHLYAPWLVLVFLALRAGRARVRIPGLSLSILLFVPIFACFTLLTFTRVLLFGGLLQGACLVVLLLCSALFPFAEPSAAQ